MLLRTKIILGFSAMLALTAILGVTGYLSTENMNSYAVQSSHIEDGKSDIQDCQYLYLHYAQTGDPRLADQVLSTVDRGAQAFRDALPYMLNPERKAKVSACADALAGLKSELSALVAAQADVMARFNEAEKLFLAAVGPYDELEKNVARMAREYSPMHDMGYGGGTDEIMDNVLGIFDIRIAINRARTLGSQLSLASSPTDRDALGAALKAVEGMLQERLKFIVVPENRALMQTVITKIAAYRQAAQAYTDALGTTAEAQSRAAATLENIKAQAAELSNAATDSVEKANARADAVIPSVCLLALLAGVAVTALLSGNVMRQLGKDPGELARIADRVAGGDFDVDDGSPARGVYSNIVKMVAMLKANIDEARHQSALAKEESGKAREAMRSAQAAGEEAARRRDSILAAAERLEAVINAVSAASEELAAQIEQSGRGAEEQAARVTETATAMEEMNSTVLEVARNAASASEFSAGTKQKAEAGAQVVQRAVTSIQEVKTQSETLRRDMDALSENAKNITQIMGVISDIADQTNLLALNAAIEAARAGDAGRGFAVVADEVRNLAEKTMASTSDVAHAIQAIQESVDKSAHQLDAAVLSIDQATDLAGQSGQALSEIVTMAEGTADQVHSIAAASEEQSATSEEITHSIAQVNDISGQTAAAMRSASDDVASLARQARNLSDLVAEMRKN